MPSGGIDTILYSNILILMNNLLLRRRAELLRTLAHPARLAVLRELARGPKCVGHLQELLEVSQPNLSQHLSALRRERVVDYYEEGNLRCYYITRPSLMTALCALIAKDHRVVVRPAKVILCAGLRRGRK